MFSWMVWTTPVAVFFSCIVLMLVGMTVWELKSPTAERKGFLPLRTTRGDLEAEAQSAKREIASKCSCA